MFLSFRTTALPRTKSGEDVVRPRPVRSFLWDPVSKILGVIRGIPGMEFLASKSVWNCTLCCLDIPVKMINSTEYPNWHNLQLSCWEHNLRKACPNGNLTGILVAPKYFQLFRRNQHEAGLSSCLLYQIKQLPPPKKSFSTRKFFFKSYRFVWVSLFFMQNPATSSVNKISHKSQIFWSEIECPCAIP